MVFGNSGFSIMILVILIDFTVDLITAYYLYNLIIKLDLT